MGVRIIRKEVPGQPTLFLLDRVYLPSISPEKAIIIFLSLLQQKGSALAGHINAIKDALVTHLFKNRYSSKSLEVEQLQERIHIVEEALSDPVGVGEIFGKLIIALKDNHRVKIWYFTAYRGEESERVVEPYGLICKRHNWYLVGYCHKSGEVRTFRVDRIRHVHLYVYEKFNYPQDFSLQEYMGQAWGVIRDDRVCRVRIKFNNTIAHLPRTIIYHPSQKIEEELPDGSIVVSYEVCGLDEMKTWIIQWGGIAADLASITHYEGKDFDPADFLPVSPHCPEQMLKEPRRPGKSMGKTAPGPIGLVAWNGLFILSKS